MCGQESRAYGRSGNVGILFFFGFVVGAIIGGLIGASAGDIVGYGFWGGVIGGVLLIVIVLLSIVAEKAKNRRQQIVQDQQWAKAAERQAIIERNQRRDKAAESALLEAGRAVYAFEELPECLEAIRRQIAEARRYRADGAFNPFWAAVEQTYSELARYRSNLNAIGVCAKVYASHVRAYASLGGDPRAFSSFPVQVTASEAHAAVAPLVQQLDEIVYDAQKVEVYAQIWAQRRTTAAVVSGFKSLEQAVVQMGSAIESSVVALGSAIDRSGTDVVRTLREYPVAAGSGGVEQLQAMRELSATSARIHDQVFRIGHGRYPMF